MSETVTLGQAIAWGEQQSEQAQAAADDVDVVAASLADCDVGGEPLALCAQIQETASMLGGLYAQFSEVMTTHTSVAEAYAATPDAGDKQFNQAPDGGGSAMPQPTPARRSADRLRLAGRADGLAPGEQVTASALVTSGADTDVALATVDGPDGRRLRVGAVWQEHAREWTAGPDVAVELDAAAAAALRAGLVDGAAAARAEAVTAAAIEARLSPLYIPLATRRDELQARTVGPPDDRQQVLAEQAVERQYAGVLANLEAAQAARSEIAALQMGAPLEGGVGYERVQLTPAQQTELDVRTERVDALARELDAFKFARRDLRESRRWLPRTVVPLPADEAGELASILEQLAALDAQYPDPERELASGVVPGAAGGEIGWTVAMYEDGEHGWRASLAVRPPAGADDQTEPPLMDPAALKRLAKALKTFTES